MRGQVAVFLVILLTIPGTAFPKDKKEKPSGLPEDILRARTVMKAIDASEKADSNKHQP